MPFLPSLRASCSTAAAPILRRLFISHPPASTPVPRAPVYNPAKDVLTPAEGEDLAMWNPMSKRAGTIMTKVGMTSVWDANGVMVPCTVLQLQECQVVQVLPPRPSKLNRPPHMTLQIGAYDLKQYIVDPEVRQRLGMAPTRKKKEYKETVQMIGHFKKHNVTPKKVLQEFKVSEDAVLPVGAAFSVAHYVPGQHVDVQATSIGKGTAGVMKRWGFGGGNASHGASKDHRAAGSTGQNQTPGRVFPGKKKAGRLGGRSATQHNLLVQRIDLSMNLMFVKGCVPGPTGAVVRVTDALAGVLRQGRKNLFRGKEEGEYLKDVKTLPFPMGTPELAETLPLVVDAAPRPLPPGQGSLY